MSQDLMNPQTGMVELGAVCAVIPARGGSKGVPRKNLRLVGGESLIARAVRTVAAAVDVVYVSTDDVEIAADAVGAGALVIDRPASIAGDTASSEAALQHALGELTSLPEVTVFVQATSPFIDGKALQEAIELVRDDTCDVAFSVTRSDVHLWRQGTGGPEGVNHDSRHRQRRQDRAPEYAETGAFYVMRTSGFLSRGHRFFGRVQMIEVDQVGALEIDTEHDLRLAELIEGSHTSNGPIPAKAVVTDFDGVHTDDLVTVDEFGIESVTVSRSDGMGVARLRRAGIPVLILSTETNPVVIARAAKLGVEVISACEDKLAALTQWAAGRGIDLADIAYLGNDVNDVDCLRSVGWPVVVAEAQTEARAASHIVLRRRGGEGAVRELADRVLDSIAPTKGHDHG